MNPLHPIDAYLTRLETERRNVLDWAIFLVLWPFDRLGRAWTGRPI